MHSAVLARPQDLPPITLPAAGYRFVAAEAMEAALARHEAAWQADWQDFAASWNDLPLDTWMADGGRYRRRRYAVLEAPAAGGAPRLLPHQPHYQSRLYNPLNGGVARHFEPIAPEVIAGRTMQAALGVVLDAFRQLRPGRTGRLQVHQFRIEAEAGSFGKPAPEGPHRDGVDVVMVMMVNRSNVSGGASEILDLHGRSLACHTLERPCETVIVDDHRVIHGVSPVMSQDGIHPGRRDVLVVTCHVPDADDGHGQYGPAER